MTASRPSFNAPLTVCAQIEARATHPFTEHKVFLRQDDRAWTYRRFRDESVRAAHFLRRRLGPIDEARPGHVAILLDNHLELVALLGGCAYGGLTLFGVNTGLRGDSLAGVINHARARLLVVDERFLPELERVRGRLTVVAPENVLVLRTGGGPVPAGSDFTAAVAAEVAPEGVSLDAPSVEVEGTTNLMVIYTSGTTGLPKGINNNHLKLLATGLGVSTQLELGPDDVGYTCMPLFHSNSVFVGLMPAFWVGGAIGVNERFSASKFVPDVLRYGVTYWNYVGEPVHYVLAAIEKQYGGDEARILAEVANHPDNHLRYAVGNGASPADIDRFIRWLGLEDMYELYGSTEAAISTFRRKSDPRGSVGEVTDPAVQILNERGKECPPAALGADGKITNYAEAVGEICRVAADTGLFQGYFDNPDANSSKYRDGVYHSGDLGHMVVLDGKRCLYFDGRTDDWIRKDGENFSAAQIARLLSEHPDVALAAAYGVPCAVSDELVMAAIQLKDGARFDPKGFFDYCETQVTGGSMDRKWFPDFVRLVDDFEFTGTQKILVRNLKALHFCRRRLPDAPIFWRTRGDSAYRPFTAADYQTVRRGFEAAERVDILDR
ncbi:MAG: AMP-binding protein [Deltaproteobacteria bacterium]|nr:AMP-binding protein [Deltaproteobacteria bacterium]